MTRLRTASDGKESEVAAFTRSLQSESRARVGEPRGAHQARPRLRRGGGKAVRSGTAHRRGRAASQCRGPQQARRALAATPDFEAAASGWHDRGRLSLSPRSRSLGGLQSPAPGCRMEREQKPGGRRADRGPLTAGIVPQQQHQPGSIQPPRLSLHASSSYAGVGITPLMPSGWLCRVIVWLGTFSLLSAI